jgi:hypothetical protein
MVLPVLLDLLLPLLLLIIVVTPAGILEIVVVEVMLL